MTEAGLKLIDRGVPIFVLPMPQAGTTGPMTLLGTCILNMAELLSAIVLFQLARPGCALISKWARRWPTCAPAGTSRPAPRSGSSI